MNRNSVRAIGLLILIPCVFIGLWPFLVGRTNMFDGFDDFTFTVLNTVILRLHHDVNGEALGDSWQGIWLLAVVGELILILVSIMKPWKRDRFKIRIRD